jgi:lipopolysaccharide export LptBFGC system permease protein LptF
MCINHILIKKKTTHLNIYCNKESIREISSEVYNRLFKPLYLFLLSSIVIFLISSSYENSNFKKIRLSIFYLGIFTIVISEISVDYSSKSTLAMFASIFLPLILCIVSYALFYKKINYKNN